MKILQTQGWDEYELIDSGNGKRLERFGDYRIVRPDPQIIWKPRLSASDWKNIDAFFDPEKKKWIIKTNVPEKWLLHYKSLSFYAKLSPFKHTGVFPEQHVMWDWVTSVIANKVKQSTKEEIASSSPTPRNDVKVLNLFGYTGIASLAVAAAGVAVTHVDASRPTIGWARENQHVSGLDDKPIRWILDDAVKFVQREIKRGNHYDGIIMDPPIYGHGPGGEKWDFSESFPQLMDLCRQILTPKPNFVLVNAYAISSSSIMLENVLHDYLKDLGGTIESGELTLQESAKNGRLLSTGIFARWSSR